jgi:uncharacterized protein (TIGR02118 family)
MYRICATYMARADMHFDLEYYFRVHVPMAKRQTAGRVRIEKMEVETAVTALMNPADVRSPCVFCIYVQEREDVEAFRRFFTGPATEPLRQDVALYTNCEPEWTVSEVRDA